MNFNMMSWGKFGIHPSPNGAIKGLVDTFGTPGNRNRDLTTQEPRLIPLATTTVSQSNPVILRFTLLPHKSLFI